MQLAIMLVQLVSFDTCNHNLNLSKQVLLVGILSPLKFTLHPISKLKAEAESQYWTDSKM